MIPVQNVYYMLAYAFRVLNEQGYKNVATEHFENTAELCAAILAKGVATQVKRGLGRDYVLQTEISPVLRGKINIGASISTGSLINRQLVCTYDEFSVNSRLNQIIKSTMELLVRSKINSKRKKDLRKLLVYFADVDSVDLKTVNWDVQYNRNNQTYRMLISVCYLVVKGLIQTNSDGTTKLMDFLDDQRMSRLYEKFILEFYKKEFPQTRPAASHIDWQLDDGFDLMLPTMKTDIMLTHREKTLIIDAKYYSESTQEQFGVRKNRSDHLYQIFTYVKNKEAELSGEDHQVSGLLLYAKTDEDVQPNQTYRMSGNTIGVRTLDLECDFPAITEQLTSYLREYLDENIAQGDGQ